ncbi:hypothetical protein L1049_013779 [Liquidambar formosana]|uniref:FAS1 domain-containing protein n=1 Tax=Liquidambar formosana TaxID=63359 RepID=A0AAP0RL93_LIQFO
MMKQLLFSFTLLQLFLFHSTTTLAQSPAQAPAAAAAPPLAKSPTTLALPPAGSTDIVKILRKAGRFSLLLRLMKNTQVSDQINNQLSTSSQGLTLFAPTDNAFSSLKSGTLNSLTGDQQVRLLQFHLLPGFLSTTQFQTASNPLRTQAGDTGDYEFPLNVTTANNQVNVSTGVVNATVTNTVYSDSQLAVYEVDKVLLPMSLFGPKPPAPSPAPALALAPAKTSASASASGLGSASALAPEKEPTQSAPKKKSPASTVPVATTDSSSSVSLTGQVMVVSIGVAVVSAFSI